MSRGGATPWLAASLMLLAACRSGPRDEIENQKVMSDSAGVRLVDNRGQTRALETRESLRFGVVDGDINLIFDQIRMVALESDGSIWVSDSHESIRRYSNEGAYLGSVGAEGSGPGESPRGYGDIWVSDSELYAVAYSPPTLQLFSKDGTYRGQRRALTPEGVTVVPLGPVRDRWLFVRMHLPEADVPEARDTWVVVEGSATATDDDSVATVLGTPHVESPYGWSAGSYFDGYPSLAAVVDGFIYSDKMDYVISRFSTSGTLTAVVRRQVDRIPYPAGLAADIRAGVESGWSQSVGSRLDDAERSRLVAAALPDSDPDWLPAIDLLLSTPDGGFWARRADQHPEPALRAVAAVFGYIPSAWLDEWRADWVFDLFDPEGGYRGTVTLPFEFTPMAVTASSVVGSITDALDVEYVVRFGVMDLTDG